MFPLTWGRFEIIHGAINALQDTCPAFPPSFNGPRLTDYFNDTSSNYLRFIIYLRIFGIG